MSDSSESPPRAAPDAFDPDTSEPPEFEPAHPRPRFDGWTAERQATFIQALAESGCVAEACRAVGMSQRSAYALRARADAVSFRNAWDTALDYAIRRLSDAVLSRAINGVARRHRGEDGRAQTSRTPLGRSVANPVRRGRTVNFVNFRVALPTIGVNSQYQAQRFRRTIRVGHPNRAIPPFPAFGTPPAMSGASADDPPHRQRGMNMSVFSNYSQRVLAAVGALAISAVLFANTLATQASEVHSLAGILA